MRNERKVADSDPVRSKLFYRIRILDPTYFVDILNGANVEIVIFYSVIKFLPQTRSMKIKLILI